MRVKNVILALLLGVCLGTQAQSYDNHQKKYSLVSLTEGGMESSRTHRMILCDYQPTGLYVKKGEEITFAVEHLDNSYKLSYMIGFKRMWGDHNNTVEEELHEGSTTLSATQEGILSFIFVKKEGYDTTPSTVNITVKGGEAFPLYHLDKSNLANWENDLKTMTTAPFVQLVSNQALITIPYKEYLSTPMKDVKASFETIHSVLNLEDELAGFDNSTPENAKTKLRINYLVDLYATDEERKNFYMYASYYMVGMKKDNFTDLISPEKLKKEWSIWHETGHTQQQSSWTWGALTEVNVNMFSLYVQEKLGQPTRLNTKEYGEKLTSFEKAKAYISNPNKNYLADNPDDYNELFAKLVLFHQLKSVYGWEVIQRVHQYFRQNPYAYDEHETDQDKANKFVYAACLATQNNLVPFFQKWGLSIDESTKNKIKELKLSAPKQDPSLIFN